MWGGVGWEEGGVGMVVIVGRGGVAGVDREGCGRGWGWLLPREYMEKPDNRMPDGV